MKPRIVGRKRLSPRGEYRLTTVFYLGLISICFFGLDYLTGPAIQEPYIYVLVVILSVWLFGAKTSYFFAAVLPLFRLLAISFWEFPWPPAATVVNVGIQIATLVIVVYLTTRIGELVVEVKTLKGKLPICIHCKKIRNQHEEWEQLEQYISGQSEVKFVHGVCPECEARYRPAVSEATSQVA